MNTYELIDCQLKNYYINGYKIVFIIVAIISMILAILSLFYDVALAFLIIAAPVDLIFLTTWNVNKRKYSSKLLLNDDKIIIFDYKGRKIKEWDLCLLNASYTSVAFDEYPKHNYRRCLILYNNSAQPYKNMEYSSFWNSSDMVIIQNPSLIEIINEKIRGTITLNL